MGNEQPKKNYQPRLQKQQLEISCIKVIGHLELQRDRRMNQGMQKEKALISMLNAPQRSKVDELHKASSIVSDMNYINGCNIVIRYCNILKDRSLLICESVGKPDNIKELLPFIESVIWAAKHLNLNALQDFQNQMLNFFGSQGIDVTSSPQVDQELKKDFETVMPTPEDINSYMVKLSEKTGIPLEQINGAGHEFYRPEDKQQQQQQQQLQFQQNNNNNQGPNVGGYFPPPNNGLGGQGGQGGQVYNINVQLPNQQYPQQYQQNQQNQNQFNQPSHQQQQWNQPPQNNQYSQPTSHNQSQNSNQFNQPQQQQQNFSQQGQQGQQGQQSQQGQQGQQGQQQNYPGFNSIGNNQNNQNQQQQFQQQQPNNNNSGLPQPQQQQFFQNNQFPSGQSSYPQQNNNNQQQQQQQGFNQPSNQNDATDNQLDSLEARLKRMREGI